MELKHLRTFLLLSEIKNFTATAHQLHYAQSYVTTQIQQLEEELNVRLFERIGKRVILTDDGNDLIPYARQMLNISDNITHRYSRQKTKRIIIGAAESICMYRLPAILASFRQNFPDTELQLKVLDTDDFIPLLAENSIDLAFTLDLPLQHKAIISPLQSNEPIAALASPDYIAFPKNRFTIADFSGTPLMLTTRNCCYRQKFEKELSDAEIIPQIILETGSVQAIKQLAVNGLGICVLPLMAVQDELQQGTLVKLNYEMDYGIVSQLIYHKDKWISPEMASFIHVCIETSMHTE